MTQPTNSTQKKIIPGLLGLFVLVVGLGVTLYLAGSSTNILQHASPSEAPENIKITNVTDSAFTVTYQTNTPLIGTVTVGDTSSTVTVLDDRDQQSDTPRPYTLHSISITELDPNTTYSFSILSGTTIFLNNGQEFSVTTGSSISAVPTAQNPITGKIIAPEGTPPSEALVYATASNGQTLSTLTDTSGMYTLPVNTMRSTDLSSYLPLAPATVFSLNVLGDTNSSNATISYAAGNPAPVITLGQDYDFTASITPVASGSASSGFPSATTSATSQEPQILTPQTPGQSFTTGQPVFQGTALPDQSVTVTIHSSSPITQTITADQNGKWLFQPTTPLAPGAHTITIQTVNSQGILQTIQQTFTVYAAEVTPTASPTEDLTALASTSPSPTQSEFNVDTPTPEVQTATPTPMANSVLTASGSGNLQTLPLTGSNTTTIVGIAGILTTIIGAIIFFFAQGAL